MTKSIAFCVLLSVLFLSTASMSLALDPAVQGKVDEKVKVVQGWGSDPALVAAVKEVSAKASTQGMTQDQWEKLGILDPKLRDLQTNAVGAWLKKVKEPWVTEAFVSLPDGSKAGLLSKTTSWSHKGKPKHEEPMGGRTWRGELEMDQSSGQQSLQAAVPVMDGTTPIASLVVGIAPSKL